MRATWSTLAVSVPSALTHTNSARQLPALSPTSADEPRQEVCARVPLPQFARCVHRRRRPLHPPVQHRILQPASRRGHPRHANRQDRQTERTQRHSHPDERGPARIDVRDFQLSRLSRNGARRRTAVQVHRGELPLATRLAKNLPLTTSGSSSRQCARTRLAPTGRPGNSSLSSPSSPTGKRSESRRTRTRSLQAQCLDRASSFFEHPIAPNEG